MRVILRANYELKLPLTVEHEVENTFLIEAAWTGEGSKNAFPRIKNTVLYEKDSEGLKKKIFGGLGLRK